MSTTSRRGPSREPSDEPPTRMLRADELKEQLRRANDDEPSTSALTRPRVLLREPATVTRWARPRRAATPPEPDATAASLDGASLRAALPRLGSPSVPITRGAASLGTAPMTPPPAPRSAGPRFGYRQLRGTLLAALAALAVAFAWSGRAATAPAAAPRATPATLLAAGPPALPAQPAVAPSLPADAPRRALDLLLEGRTRDALDAYRALTLVHPSHGAFAQTVRLLEHELRACASGGVPCP